MQAYIATIVTFSSGHEAKLVPGIVCIASYGASTLIIAAIKS